MELCGWLVIHEFGYVFGSTGFIFLDGFSAVSYLSLKTVEDLAFRKICIRFAIIFSLREVGTIVFSKIGIYYIII